MSNNISEFTRGVELSDMFRVAFTGLCSLAEGEEWIVDIYGKLVPPRPPFATLDGLPVDEYNAKTTQPTPTHAIVSERGQFAVSYRCYSCKIVTNFDMCRCCGTLLNPELVEKSTS